MLPGTFAEMNLITPPWPTNPPLFIVASGEDMIAQVNSSKSILMKVRDIKQVPGRKGKVRQIDQWALLGPVLGEMFLIEKCWINNHPDPTDGRKPKQPPGMYKNLVNNGG